MMSNDGLLIYYGYSETNIESMKIENTLTYSLDVTSSLHTNCVKFTQSHTTQPIYSSNYHILYSIPYKQRTFFQIIAAQQIKKNQWKR